MDPALLDDAGRAELLEFYSEVFGWTRATTPARSATR